MRMWGQDVECVIQEIRERFAIVDFQPVIGYSSHPFRVAKSTAQIIKAEDHAWEACFLATAAGCFHDVGKHSEDAGCITTTPHHVPWSPTLRRLYRRLHSDDIELVLAKVDLQEHECEKPLFVAVGNYHHLPHRELTKLGLPELTVDIISAVRLADYVDARTSGGEERRYQITNGSGRVTLESLVPKLLQKAACRNMQPKAVQAFVHGCLGLPSSKDQSAIG